MSVSRPSTEISYGGGEQPRYAALRHAIDAYYHDLLPPLQTLRAAVFGVLRLADPRQKDADEDEFEASEADLALIDQAVEIFLTAMAGPDRSAGGFAHGGQDTDTPDGILQQRDIACYQLGLSRGAELQSAAQTLRGERQSPAVNKMLEDAFARLSDNGALRLEGVRDDIHGILASAQEAGLSPIETGRQLAAQFDDYSGYEFQRLARTEAAFASEAGVRDQLKDLGVEKVEWLTSAGACDECEDLAAGGPYAIDDEDNLPPAHPNCLCSTAPVSEDDDTSGDGGDDDAPE